MNVKDKIASLEQALQEIRTLDEMRDVLATIDENLETYKPRDQIELLAFRANCYVNKRLFLEAVPDSKRVMEIGEKMNDEEGLINAGMIGINCGLFTAQAGSLDESIRYFDRSIDILRRIEKTYPNNLLDAMLHRAAIRKNVHDSLDECLIDYLGALEVVRRNKEDIEEERLIAVVGNLQIIYGISRQSEKAEKLADEFQNPRIVYNAMSACYMNEDYVKFVELGERFLELTKVKFKLYPQRDEIILEIKRIKANLEEFS